MAHVGKVYPVMFERDLSRVSHVNAQSPKRWIFKPRSVFGTVAHHWASFTMQIHSEEGIASYDLPGSIVWRFPPPPLANPATFVKLVYELSNDEKFWKYRIEFWFGLERLGYLQKLPGTGSENTIEPLAQLGELWVVTNPTLFGGFFIGSFGSRRWNGTSIP